MLHTKQKTDSVFPNMTHAVVGGFVFLRFLCPAIVTPHKFGLTSSEYNIYDMIISRIFIFVYN